MRQINKKTQLVTILLVFKKGEPCPIRLPKKSIDHFCAGAEITPVLIASM
jgi:hypothetical protein